MSNYINATINGTNESIKVKTYPEFPGFEPQAIHYFSFTKNTSPTTTTTKYYEINLNSQKMLTEVADKEPDLDTPKHYYSIIRLASPTTTEFIETNRVTLSQSFR